MAGEHDRLVRIDVEEPLDDVAEEQREAVGVLLGVADPTREQRIAGEDEVRRRAVLQDVRDGAGRVAPQVHRAQVETTEVLHIAVVEDDVDRNGDAGNVLPSRRSAGARFSNESLKGPDMVPVLMRRRDEREPGRLGRVLCTLLEELPESGEVVGRVDEHLLPRFLRRDEVHIVVHVAHRDAPDGDVVEVVDEARHCASLGGLGTVWTRPMRLTLVVMEEADFPGAWRPDQDHATPLFEQLRRRVADLVADGSLPAGRRLPPVRSLAADLGVAPHTVARAYRELEEAKVVVTRGRAGTVVAPRDEREEELTTAASAFASTASARGCSFEEAAKLLEQAYSRL